jgi:hypothetical protein
VCGPCSNNSIELEIDGDVQAQRVCDECREKMEIDQGIQVLVGSEDMPVDADTQVLIKVVLLKAQDLHFHSDGQSLLQLPTDARNRNPYVVFYIGERRIKESDPCPGGNPVWDQFFQLRVSVASQYADFLIAEVWDKSRGMNVDEMIGKCRIPLYSLGPQQESCNWHTLFKHGRRRGRLAVHVQRGTGGTRAEESPILYMHIPHAAPMHGVQQAQRLQRSLLLETLFPPDSRLHDWLFYIISSSSSDTSVGPRTVPANELVLVGVENILLEFKTKVVSSGALLVTSHRLLFVSEGAPEASSVSLPLGEIQNVLLRRRWKEQFHALEATTKDSIVYTFALRRAPGAEMRQLQLLRRCREEIEWLKLEDNFAFKFDLCHRPENHDGDIQPATCSSTPKASNTDTEIGRWHSTAGSLLRSVSLREEYERVGFTSHPNWRISSVNKGFNMCPTYPELLAVPTEALGVSDDFLRKASQYRSIQRIPTATWMHPYTHAVLCRSSQPLVGITFSACPEDEQLLLAIRGTVLQLQPQELGPTESSALHSATGESFDVNSSWTDITPLRTSLRRR